MSIVFTRASQVLKGVQDSNWTKLNDFNSIFPLVCIRRSVVLKTEKNRFCLYETKRDYFENEHVKIGLIAEWTKLCMSGQVLVPTAKIDSNNFENKS